MESKQKLQPSILHRTLRILIPVLLFVWVIQSQVGFASSHGHSHDDHDHGHHHGNPQPASFKYSREANEVHAHSHGHDDHHDHGHSHGSAAKQSEHHHHHDHDEGSHGERDFNIWLHAISSTLLISAAPFFILFFIKVDNSKEKEKFLKILLSFASGGLLGDAFLHLIPHAIMAKGGDGHGHSHGHSHGGSQEKPKFTDEELEEFHGHDLSVGIWVLVGIVTFLVVEKLIRIANGGHGHSHSAPSESPKKQDDSAAGSKKKKDGSKSPAKKEVAETKAKGKSGPVGEIKVAGYLNLAADFLHNFTDGLAIGASYLAGQPVGMVTTFTVLLHEIPHEIGDFAILIQSGSSRKKAIFLQLLTALGALAGTIVSLWYGDIGDAASSGVLPFTAGGFIYIATVSVIPDLLQNSTFGQSVKEIIALLAGVYMMVIIAKFE